MCNSPLLTRRELGRLLELGLFPLQLLPPQLQLLLLELQLHALHRTLALLELLGLGGDSIRGGGGGGSRGGGGGGGGRGGVRLVLHVTLGLRDDRLLSLSSLGDGEMTGLSLTIDGQPPWPTTQLSTNNNDENSKYTAH